MRSRVLTLAMLFTVSDAFASTAHYISASGTATWAQSTVSTSPASLTTANSSASAGDSVVLAGGTYPAAIDPQNQGSSSTNRIVFAGASGNPTSAIVTAINIRKSYVTVRWVRSTGSLNLMNNAYQDTSTYATWALVLGCRIENDLTLQGAKDCMVYGNTIVESTNGSVVFEDDDAGRCYSMGLPTGHCTVACERDTVRNNTISLGVIGYQRVGLMLWGHTQHCVVDSNAISGTFTPDGGSQSPTALWIANSYSNSFTGNTWTFDATADASGKAWYFMYLRDSSSSNVFTGEMF